MKEKVMTLAEFLRDLSFYCCDYDKGEDIVVFSVYFYHFDDGGYLWSSELLNSMLVDGDFAEEIDPDLKTLFEKFIAEIGTAKEMYWEGDFGVAVLFEGTPILHLVCLEKQKLGKIKKKGEIKHEDYYLYYTVYTKN